MILFAILQLINVILQTLKTLTAAKGDVHQGAIMNAVAFGFYTIVLRELGNYPLYYVVMVSIITNLIGFYSADYLFRKIKKDKIWRITTELTQYQKNRNEAVEDFLKENNIKFFYTQTDKNNYVLDIFTKNQKESRLVRNIIDKTDSIIYVTEMGQRL